MDTAHHNVSRANHVHDRDSFVHLYIPYIWCYRFKYILAWFVALVLGSGFSSAAFYYAPRTQAITIFSRGT